MKKGKLVYSLIIATVFSFGIGGCGSSGSDGKNGNAALIHEVSTEANFSSQESKDKFSLQLIGEKATEAELNFYIIRGESDTIYRELMRGKDLLPEGDNSKKSDEELKQDIIDAMSYFFNAEKFLRPAAEGGVFPDLNDIDIEVYRTVQAEPKAIGFFYKIKGPIQRMIAYSSAEKEVLMYYSCCRDLE